MSDVLKSKTLIYMGIMFIIIGISSYYFFILAIVFIILGLRERKRENSQEFKSLKKGDNLYKLGKFLEAEEELNKIINTKVLGIHKEQYYLLLMKIALEKGKFEEARKYMESVSKGKIYTDIDLMIKLSSTYISCSEYKDAIVVLLNLLKVNKYSNFTLLNLSYSYYKLGNMEESNKYLNKIKKEELKKEQKNIYEEIIKA